MTEASLRARMVRIQFEHGRTGLIYATSPDLRGLLVARTTHQALVDALPAAIEEMYAAAGESVVVTPLEAVGSDEAWVAIPADLAARALAHRATA